MVFDTNKRDLSRRRLLALGGALLAGIGSERIAAADAGNLSIKAPYLPQGGSGSDDTVNCGPATVAMAVNYSGSAAPSVANVRATLGRPGPTDIDQWAWLLDVYGVPWYPTWSQTEILASLRKGHPVVIASWMASFSAAADFEVPWADPAPWQGRYCDYAQGHAMMIVGFADEGLSYLAHDPNVFPGDSAHFYSDGSPKGAYRRYSAAEVWYTVSTYAGGLGFAIVPYSRSLPPAERVKRVDPESDGIFDGPGGGISPRRETRSLGTAISRSE